LVFFHIKGLIEIVLEPSLKNHLVRHAMEWTEESQRYLKKYDDYKKGGINYYTDGFKSSISNLDLNPSLRDTILYHTKVLNMIIEKRREKLLLSGKQAHSLHQGLSYHILHIFNHVGINNISSINIDAFLKANTTTDVKPLIHVLEIITRQFQNSISDECKTCYRGEPEYTNICEFCAGGETVIFISNDGWSELCGDCAELGPTDKDGYWRLPDGGRLMKR
jgi:hypothetical protein